MKIRLNMALLIYPNVMIGVVQLIIPGGKGLIDIESIEVIRCLAGTGIFGPIDKVYDQNLYDVIVLLYKQRVEYLNNLENTK